MLTNRLFLLFSIFLIITGVSVTQPPNLNSPDSSHHTRAATRARAHARADADTPVPSHVTQALVPRAKSPRTSNVIVLNKKSFPSVAGWTQKKNAP